VRVQDLNRQWKNPDRLLQPSIWNTKMVHILSLWWLCGMTDGLRRVSDDETVYGGPGRTALCRPARPQVGTPLYSLLVLSSTLFSVFLIPCTSLDSAHRHTAARRTSSSTAATTRTRPHCGSVSASFPACCGRQRRPSPSATAASACNAPRNQPRGYVRAPVWLLLAVVVVFVVVAWCLCGGLMGACRWWPGARCKY
jgi:hypothetical protein